MLDKINIKSPKTKSPEKSPEQLELERLKHDSEVRKLKKDAFFDELGLLPP